MSAIVTSFKRRLRPWLCAVLRLLAVCGLATTLAGCAWIDAKQRELVYRPTPGRPADFVGMRAGDQTFTLDVPGARAGRTDKLQLWWLPNPDQQAPTLLYLHGTFRNLFQNYRKIDALRDAGFGVLAVEYRGWGESSAVLPSEDSIDADTASAWGEMVRRQPDPHKRVIFGHSLGGAVAVELASHKHVGSDYAALILESTFTRLPDIAKSLGLLGRLVSLMATQEFDSIDKIAGVDAPILMMHGTADDTVPFALGRALYQAAPVGTRWVPFEGGSHSGLDLEQPVLYRESVRGVIARLPS
jgi:pimeloyl-ACP methyl ester carboxylesterase